MAQGTIVYFPEVHLPLCCQGRCYNSHCSDEETEAKSCELTLGLLSTDLACLWAGWLRNGSSVLRSYLLVEGGEQTYELGRLWHYLHTVPIQMEGGRCGPCV